MTALDHSGLQKLWMAGTLEQLCVLKFMADVPYSVPDCYRDLYQCLNPFKLFQSEDDLRSSLRGMIRSEDTPFGDLIPEDEITSIGDLVMIYLDDPESLMKIYLQENEENLL